MPHILARFTHFFFIPVEMLPVVSKFLPLTWLQQLMVFVFGVGTIVTFGLKIHTWYFSFFLTPCRGFVGRHCSPYCTATCCGLKASSPPAMWTVCPCQCRWLRRCPPWPLAATLDVPDACYGWQEPFCKHMCGPYLLQITAQSGLQLGCDPVTPRPTRFSGSRSTCGLGGVGFSKIPMHLPENSNKWPKLSVK